MSTIYSVWYMKPEFFSKGMMGEVPASDMSTHMKVKEIKIDYAHPLLGMLEWIFRDMQAESWSPNGEARPLIEKLGLSHTSMSVGDVIECEGRFWVVKILGFKEVKKKGGEI